MLTKSPSDLQQPIEVAKVKVALDGMEELNTIPNEIRRTSLFLKCANPGLFFCFFHSFSTKTFKKNCWLQQDLKSDVKVEGEHADH